jgi:hypothetical protein
VVEEKPITPDAATLLGLWQACRSIPGLNEQRWRYDHAELLMKWEDYGNRKSNVGWQVAYIVALEDGGADHVDNLRAVSFSARILKGDGPTG